MLEILVWQAFQVFITFLHTNARAIEANTFNTLGIAVRLSIAITSPGLGQLPNAE